MNKPIRYMKTLIAAASALAIVSCTKGGIPDPDGEKPVRIGARTALELQSRAYQASGDVRSGTYYLTYTARDKAKAVAKAEFGDSETGEANGIVTLPSGDRLLWKFITDESVSTFCLDNVPKSLDVGDGEGTTVMFGSDNNPFKAARFDEVDGKNDLLWGTRDVSRNAENIHFDLHHNMSRVRVQVTVNRKNSTEGALDLDGAEVKITSLIHTPLSFNRLDGTLALGEDYADLVLADRTIGWNSDLDKSEGDTEMRTTYDFVLPPQALSDENRPRLVIKLIDGSVYSGILPHAMEINSPEYKNPYPVALSFLKEHILTLRTEITEAPPSLSFMPVTVVEWIDRGSFTLEGHQAGIYTTADFEDLLRWWDEYNEDQLARYGLLEDDGKKWMFSFWGPIDVKSDIKGQMQVTDEKKDYYFKFHGFKHLVGGKVVEKEEELKKILTDDE